MNGLLGSPAVGGHSQNYRNDVNTLLPDLLSYSMYNMKIDDRLFVIVVVLHMD